MCRSTDMSGNPYEQVPYRCQPIEWTAPERLALASLLHGGPCPDVQRCRVLELGCGDGSNLLPLSYYRPQAQFVGVDGAGTQIELAKRRCRQLQLANVEFLHLDFMQANDHLDGQFDFIIAHGIFSWVPDDVRDALLTLCRQRLADNGLLYLNYNARPGWNVRGMVRDYLLALTASGESLQQRAVQAQRAASGMAQALEAESHPFSQLLASEFRFVCDNHSSYVAHEYLAEHNHAYWRSEFLALAAGAGFHPVADADFNYPSGRIDSALPERLKTLALTGLHVGDTVDLVTYRQLHSPLLARQPVSVRAPADVLGSLQVAACLAPVGVDQPGWFVHPNGFQVETREAPLHDALQTLARIWPRSESVASLLQDNERAVADLLLLHQHGLVELRLPQAPVSLESPHMNRLNQHEWQWGGYYTTAHHQRVESMPDTLAERLA